MLKVLPVRARNTTVGKFSNNWIKFSVCKSTVLCHCISTLCNVIYWVQSMKFIAQNQKYQNAEEEDGKQLVIGRASHSK